MNKFLIFVLVGLLVPLHCLKNSGGGNPPKSSPSIDEPKVVPVLVKPKRFYNLVEEEVVAVLVKPKRFYNTKITKENIKDKVREVTAWERMLSKVKYYESFKSKAYKCCGGVMTIGYGYTKDVKWGDVVTEEEALKLLEEELLLAKSHVLRIVKVPLNEHQLAALTSFTFNCGQGALRSLVSSKSNRLNHGNYESIKHIMPKYRMAGGKVRKGLELRRKWEVSLWSNEA